MHRVALGLGFGVGLNSTSVGITGSEGTLFYFPQPSFYSAHSSAVVKMTESFESPWFLLSSHSFCLWFLRKNFYSRRRWQTTGRPFKVTASIVTDNCDLLHEYLQL